MAVVKRETQMSRDAHEATRNEILAAARRRYSRFGPRKTTMTEVAREASCCRATLYSHFPGKEALYAALLEREAAEFLVEIETVAASSQEARHKLGAILEATTRIYAGGSPLGEALAGDEEMSLERVARPAVEAYEKRVLELLAQTLEQGVAEGAFRAIETRPIAYLMYHLGRVLVTREVSGRGDFPLARILAVMDDLLAHGIAVAGKKSP
jgi:AcrR family transcriptional regulator